MPNATKKILAMSLKKLLAQRPLDDITIQDLVNDAQVSRKTFYYHFRDIYDLLDWVFVDEGKRVLEGRPSAETWQQAMRNVFSYFGENRAMILNVCRCVQKDSGPLKEHVTRLIQPLLQQIFDAQPNRERVTEEDRAFILELYSYGLVELFLNWINRGMKPEASRLMDQIERLFSGSMESLIQRCLESGGCAGG